MYTVSFAQSPSVFRSSVLRFFGSPRKCEEKINFGHSGISFFESKVLSIQHRAMSSGLSNVLYGVVTK